jgi:hypothetical protein
MSFYDKKVTYGDYLKVVFTYDGNKIVKSALTDISDITDNNDGTVTEIVATNPNNVDLGEVQEGQSKLDEYYQDHDTLDMPGIINSVVGYIGEVPAFFAAVFPFLPGEITVLLLFSISTIVVLRIAGR